MGRPLLLAAAVVAAAAAVGEYKTVLGGACGCGIGSAGIQTYNLTTAAYCPTSSYPSCNVTNMVEKDCTISCSGPRAALVYRNNSALWKSTTSISCINGELKNSEGQALYNLQRPTCAYKYGCMDCPVEYQSSCPTGMTCQHTVFTLASDDCKRLLCQEGSLKLYDNSGAPMDYQAKELYCTVVGKWTNYSLDGSIVGGNTLLDPFTANCVFPKACEDCVAPRQAADLSELPTSFRTGYELTSESDHEREGGSCSKYWCPIGFTLYGFSGTATTVTGLEYTSKEFLKCDGNSRWTNGGYESSPNNLLVACLKFFDPACGSYNNFYTNTGANVVCKNGQNRMQCPTPKKIEIHTAMLETIQFEHMTFVAGRGWLAFDCSGGAKLFKSSDDIEAVACK